MITLTKTLLTTVALLAGVVQAQAAPQRLTDTAYLQAIRCRGLAAAGGVDTTAMDAMLKAQKGGRDGYIGERAKTMARDVKREVGRANGSQKGQHAAELSGVCAAYIEPAAELASRR